ncbi:hypothetical protein GCM10020331_091470 [Ectobacillus funiculus]
MLGEKARKRCNENIYHDGGYQVRRKRKIFFLTLTTPNIKADAVKKVRLIDLIRLLTNCLREGVSSVPSKVI